jgi:antitoxin (DNA-binding transcriptional repressor) of toxin-antitoxin stability system
MDMVTSELTVTATEFKAQCLDILRRLGEHRLSRVTVTRRGKTVAIITPPQIDEAVARAVIGSMVASVHIPEGFDLTAPVVDVESDADLGILHR